LFTNLKPGEVRQIPQTDHLDATWHQWSQPEIDALTLAMAARRPLLVSGEPGTGKTQLARAAAHHLGWQLESTTIHSRYEPQDLLFRFDAVRRLADAQWRDADADWLKKRDHDYWEPGPLWRAFGWASAVRYGSCRTLADKPSPEGHVLLIDEIDKAESDLPNALLEVLGQRSFRIPGLNNLPIGGPDQALPLVIITTNEERELPPAFLRRCIVLNLDAGRGTYKDWLLARGRAHFGQIPDAREKALITDEVLTEAATQLAQDRQAAKDAGLPPPGVAEYLDLLYALDTLAPKDEVEQLEQLKRLKAYAFRKHGHVEGHPELSQREVGSVDVGKA
jgi:MoxR-like ATPase